MNFADLIKTAIAYLLDNPILPWGVVVLYFCFSNQGLKAKNKKISIDHEKLQKEKQALELDAQVGKALVTTIKALKS
jgi:hypothetical protein